MKKSILTVALAAAVSIGAGAKTADELRVYINPGHGSWTPNDRPAILVGHGAYSRTNTDTLSFFESNTNLWKGFGVLERLIGYGLKFDRTLNQTGNDQTTGAARDMSNNIVMSRVKNGPYHDDNGTGNQLGDDAPEDLEVFNRNLSEICAEVEANNFDLFISIHSNAADEGTNTNFPLYLYRGYDTPKEDEGNLSVEFQQTCRDMAAKCWAYGFNNTHAQWTAYSVSNMNLRGDINFYGGSSIGDATGSKGYLAVLKHTVPGFLVEGYFHTYQPARHRAMNPDVCYVEGDAYAHGIADYFGLTKESEGKIYGIVRDLHEKFNDVAYKPNSATLDAYKPLNGAKAILKKDGKEVATYITDNYYNGAFVFSVEPGKYTVEVEHPDYKAAEPVEVVVKAADVVYPTVQLEATAYEPPAIVYENYPDPYQDNKAVMPADEYTLAQEYVDQPVAQLEGKIVRRSVVRDGKMYVLAIDKDFEYAAKLEGDAKPKSTIVVIDLATKAVTDVSTEGMSGSVLDASDLQVSADGVLLACNMTKTQYSSDYVESGDAGRGTFTIYKWANDENGMPTGNPEAFVSTQQSGRWFRAYPGKFAYTGTIAEGKAFITMPTITAPAYKMRSTVITVIDGTSAGAADFLSPNDYGEDQVGRNYTLVTSPLDKDGLYLVGENGAVREMKYNWTDKVPYESVAGGALAESKANGLGGMFRYAGGSFVALADNADGKNVGIALYNISNNIAKSTAVGLTNGAVAEAEAASVAVAAESQAVRDADGNVTDAFINLYLLRDGKLSKLTTKGVTQPQGRKEYAYGLSSKEFDSGTTVRFSLTGDAANVDIVLTPVGGGEEIVVSQGALSAGEHTFNLNDAGMEADKLYNWAVRVSSKAVATAGLVSADNNGNLSVRGGVIPVTDPNFDSFGYVAVNHGKNQGIDIYDPTGKKVADRIFKNHALWQANTTNQSNTIRGTERDGKVVLGAWGDAACGISYIDPMDTTAEPVSMFAGKNNGTGCYVYNDIKLGGGTSGVAFVGSGENTRLYSFDEDNMGQNGKGANENALVYWNIGTGWQIETAPTCVGYKSMLQNTNVDLLSYGNGLFASQVRSAGNNAAGIPSFIYIDADSEDVTFNSVDLLTEDNATNFDGSNSAIAITKDGKTFAAGNAAGKIFVYDVTWQDTKPTLTFKYTVPIEGAAGWGQMRFDYAGNLHYYQREQGGYHVYALPDAAPVVTTPAKADDVLRGIGAGVSDITVDDNNAGEAVYYNLNGVRVQGTLAPGLYIRVQGDRAEKVVIK